MQSEAAALVDALEALRVLHSHEEFLSQVLKGFVSGKIQAVEAGEIIVLQVIKTPHLVSKCSIKT